MPLTEKGSEILRNMQKQYGEKKGEEVFYASKNKGTITGVDDAPATDLTPSRWKTLRRLFNEWISEEEAEPEHEGEDESKETKEHNEGKLSEKTREEIGRVDSPKREDMPDDTFLLPSEKKYPVKKDGKYDHGLLLAAAREARMHGHEELAKKADEIREREFKSGDESTAAAKDEKPLVEVESNTVDMAMDWAGLAVLDEPVNGILSLAFDRGSVRNVDEDGVLHVSEANISKANVCPYWGDEIPEREKLGLDPKRKYLLLRHPDELERAADTWNNKPILNTHVAATADSFPQEQVIGSVGSEGRYDHPYVKNSLAFWPKAAIDSIKSNTKKQLSASYRYDADMTPGDYKGVKYDGVMRNIRGNHVALVAEGRAGSDVYVGDSAFDSALGEDEEIEMALQLTPKAAMAEGMFLGHFGPLLKQNGMAMDSAASMFAPIFAGITSKNYHAQIPALEAALRAALKGKLANDADINAVPELLMALDSMQAGADTATEANAGLPSYMCEDEKDADDETEEEREEDEEEDRKARDARKRLGRDETEEEREEREEKEEDRSDDERDEEDEDENKKDDADDRKAKRASDLKKKFGRDATEEEMEEERRKEEARDKRRARDQARDRRRLGRDYRRARDAHRRARDAHRGHVADWRRAHDAQQAAMDVRNADDAARCAADMQAADAACKSSYDSLVKARDARHRARDARRAWDKKYWHGGRDRRRAHDEHPNSGGTKNVLTREAMDAAIEERVSERVAQAIRENDRRHFEIAEALEHVRTLGVGRLAMDSSTRSVADVYDRALTVMGIEHDGIRDAKALKRLLEVAPRHGNDQIRPSVFAQDSAPADARKQFNEWFPEAAKIERM